MTAMQSAILSLAGILAVVAPSVPLRDVVVPEMDFESVPPSAESIRDRSILRSPPQVLLSAPTVG